MTETYSSISFRQNLSSGTCGRIKHSLEVNGSVTTASSVHLVCGNELQIKLVLRKIEVIGPARIDALHLD